MNKPECVKTCPLDGVSEDRRGWHVERAVNLPALLTLLTMLMGWLAYAQRQDTRVTRVEEHTAALDNTDLRLEKAVTALKEDWVRRSDRIEGKLDRLIERGGR